MNVKNAIKTKIIPFVGKLFRSPSILPVIYYHNIVNNGEGFSYMHTDEERFCEQMKFLSEQGYETLLFSELSLGMKKKKHDKKILITFDDGFESNYRVVFPLAKELGIKFNVFLAYDYIGKDNYLTEQQIIEMQQSGLVEFGYHTKSHCDSRTLTDGKLYANEILEGHALTQKLCGREVKDFCFPYGYYSKEVIDRITKDGLFDRIYTSNYIKPTLVNGKTVCGRIGIDNAWRLDMFKKNIDGHFRIMHYYSKIRVGIPKIK